MAVNCWKYSREVYLVGRSVKFRPFTEQERLAVILFITGMKASRPAYVDYINLKADNAGKALLKQNDYSLGKMVQKIGRSLKVQFCTESEKALCDALFLNTDPRRYQGYDGYVSDTQSSSSSEQQSSSSESSSSEQESSSSEEA